MAAVLLALGIPARRQPGRGPAAEGGRRPDRRHGTLRVARAVRHRRPNGSPVAPPDERASAPCSSELVKYHERVRHQGRRLLPRRAGPWPTRPDGPGRVPGRSGRGPRRVRRGARRAAAATTRRRSGRGNATVSSSRRRSSGTATSSPSWSPTRPPGRCAPGSCAAGWSSAPARPPRCCSRVGAALRLTGWVLRPVRVLDATTHDIATGRLKSRVAAAGGPPELRRLARSFNEMADNVEDVLEQQRAFVADASHQLRNPLVRAAAAHRAARPRTPRGQRGDRLRPHRGQAPRPGPGRPARPGAGRARRGGPAAHRHRRADRRAGRVLAPVADDKGVRLVADLPRHDRLGRPDRALQRPGRGDRQRAEVHTRGRVRSRSTVASDGEVVDRRRHRPRARASPTRNSPASATASGAAAGHQNVKGSGLGLSISRALLAAGGGSIAYDRHEPHGLRVTVTVPRTAPRPERRRARACGGSSVPRLQPLTATVCTGPCRPAGALRLDRAVVAPRRPRAAPAGRCRSRSAGPPAGPRAPRCRCGRGC